MDKTQLIWFSVSELKIMTAKHLLKQAGIESFTIDKRDSAHAGIFGEIELYVPKIFEDQAYHLLVENGVIIPDDSDKEKHPQN